jgi:hypothetical protein
VKKKPDLKPRSMGASTMVAANPNSCVLNGGVIPLNAEVELIKALAIDEIRTGPEKAKLIKAIQDIAFKALYDAHQESCRRLLDDVKTKSVKDLLGWKK